MNREEGPVTSYFLPPKRMALDWWCPVNINCDPCYIERCIKQLSWVYLWTEGSVCNFLFWFETIPTNKCKTLSLLLILQVRLISKWPSGQIFIITVYLCAWQKGMIMSPILSKEIFVSITFKKQNSCMVSSKPAVLSQWSLASRYLSRDYKRE